MVDNITDIQVDQLIKAAAGGDREALTSLIEHPKIRELVNRISVRAARKYNEDQDDVKQSIFMGIFSTDTFRGSGYDAFSRWLHVIAERYCLNQRKRKDRDYVRAVSTKDRKLGGRPFVQFMNSPSVEESVVLALTAERLLKSFPMGLVSGWVDGKSAREIARETGIPTATVYRTLTRMQKEIMQAGLSEIEIIRNARKDPDADASISIGLNDVIETVTKLTPDLIAHLQSQERDLERLNWEVFEHLVAEFFASSGFEDVRLVGRNSQTSADIFAAYYIDSIRMRVRYFIEVKRRKKKIGVEIIDQVYGAMLNERPKFGWHAAMIVSLVGFRDIKKYSREELVLKGVELRDRDDLLNWLRGYKRHSSGLYLPEPRTALEFE